MKVELRVLQKQQILQDNTLQLGLEDPRMFSDPKRSITPRKVEVVHHFRMTQLGGDPTGFMEINRSGYVC